MNRLLRSLANAAQGRGGLGLSPEAGRAWTAHSVPSDERGIGLRQRPHASRLGRPDLSPPHRRHGQLLLVLSSRRCQRRRRLRELEHRRIRAVPAAHAHQVRGRRADQRRVRAALAGTAVARASPRQPRCLCRQIFRTCGRFRGARRQSAYDRRRRPLRAASILGRRDFPHDASCLSRVQPDVRAARECRRGSELGPSQPIGRQDGGRSRCRPIRRSPSSPAATSTTARGSESTRSSSAVGGCGSAPKSR